MRDYIEAADLPHDEKVYLKKDFLGWRVVEPPTRWWHYIVGTKKNFAQLIIALALIGLIYLGVQELVSSYQLIAASPCDFCTDCFEQTRSIIRDINRENFNLSLDSLS